MRLVILCEGETEQRVLKSFLAPYCTGFDIVDTPIDLKGSGKIKRKGITVAQAILSEDSDAIVLCLIDLKESPFTFPAYVERSSDPLETRYNFIQQYFDDRMNRSYRDRFWVFPVMMEIETWLLADVDVLNRHFSPPSSQRIQPIPSPESVEDPSGQLKTWHRQYKKKEYSKTVDGERLFENLAAKTVFEDNCPHFNRMIDKLLEIQGIQNQNEMGMIVDNPHYQLSVELAELWDKRLLIIQEMVNAAEKNDINRWDELDTQLLSIDDQIARLDN